MKRNLEWVKAAAKYAIGFGLLAYVVWQNWEPKGDSNPGLKGLLRQEPNWLALASMAGFLTVAVGLQFLRWYVLVRGVDLPFTLRNAFRLGLVGYFYSLFLPGAIAGDFVKAYFIVKEQPSKKAVAVATVLVDRLFGLFGLLFLAASVGGALWLAGDEQVAGNAYLRKIVSVAVVLVSLAIVGWFAMGYLNERRANAIASRLHRIPKLGPSLAEMWFAARLYRNRPRVIVICALISAGSHTMLVFMLHAATRAFPALATDAATLVEHFIIGPIGFIVQVFIFFAPGGVGGSELLFGYLYGQIGRNEATGVIGRLTFRSAEYLFGLLGYVTFLRMKKELPAEPSADGLGVTQPGQVVE